VKGSWGNVVVAVFAFAFGFDIEAQTCSCAPQQTKGDQCSRLSIGFDSSVPYPVRFAFASAADTWNYWFNLSGNTDVGFDITGGSAGQVTVTIDPELAGTSSPAFNLHAWDGSGTIHVNPCDQSGRRFPQERRAS
jgi:hypothetical protein